MDKVTGQWAANMSANIGERKVGSTPPFQKAHTFAPVSRTKSGVGIGNIAREIQRAEVI